MKDSGKKRLKKIKYYAICLRNFNVNSGKNDSESEGIKLLFPSIPFKFFFSVPVRISGQSPAVVRRRVFLSKNGAGERYKTIGLKIRQLFSKK